jgi:AhpD family alkylhydroperoxidase
MTRIPGVPRRQAGPLVRLVYRLTERQLGRMVDNVALYAHRPRLLLGYGMFEKAVASAPRVEERLRSLVVLKAAAMQGCEFCIDLGSSEARSSGISDEQLLDLHRYRDSERFDDAERLVLDLAVAMTSTPTQVTDELMAALGSRFDEAQLVELVNLIAVENLRSRFNGAFAIGSAGFSEGMVCARPEAQASSPTRDREPVGLNVATA